MNLTQQRQVKVNTCNLKRCTYAHRPLHKVPDNSVPNKVTAECIKISTLKRSY